MTNSKQMTKAEKLDSSLDKVILGLEKGLEKGLYDFNEIRELLYSIDVLYTVIEETKELDNSIKKLTN